MRLYAGAASVGRAGFVYTDGMVGHDGHVGQLLKLGDLGIATTPSSMYSTDNGAETFSWRTGARPFRGEKNTQWKAATACRCCSAGRA